ncbi:sensor histidine kinase [Paenibacillus sp. NPDC058071]|uniref:sensor histidine kinase n=1 Tax=Paenibacillus sp. NPDC058071 TaxID=3346326 RepID=UPI0036DA4F4D
MTEAAIALLLLLCAGLFIYILRMKKQERLWLETLRGIRRGERDKIFVRGSGTMAEIAYELNGIVDANQSQLELLRKNDEANKQILTSLSHDVRTPLASLLGYLDALRGGGLSDPAEVKDYLSVAHRKAGDLKSFVDMLFEWFKLNSNEQPFYVEQTDINELTREVIIEWLPLLEQSEIALSAEIEDTELIVSIDKTAYRRILGNLLQNAVKHGECTQISITVTPRLGAAVAEVANNGNPIPERQLPFIFDRLYKGDAARSDKGSGLGLAIAKELADALNSELSVSSAPGQETVFSISIPILK